MDIHNGVGQNFRNVSAVLIAAGSLSLIFSIFATLQILAFVGLGLIFWGAIFLLTAPRNYINMLDNTVFPMYSTLGRLIKDLAYEKKCYYIPSIQNDGPIPEHLKGLQDPVVLISKEKSYRTPLIEDIKTGRFLLSDLSGALIVPPGLGIYQKIRSEIKEYVSGVSLEEVCNALPGIILAAFPAAKKLTMSQHENFINLVMANSAYERLYSSQVTESVHLIGCPIVSAVAAVLAQATGKAVTIEEAQVDSSASLVKISFSTVS